MAHETVQALLGWTTLINLALLLWWFLVYAFAHEWMYKFHSRWFNLSRLRFDEIHYSAMAGYKMLIIVFNLVPYLALRLISH